ncbi:hypothetical protein BJ508DRAFT_372211 [Ascobolus immersus RN42]|uniref:Uncharacterized protein n=1 Tax=Ascobolus immersus RN42 TaxID=1160509 RepID=A0A3N4ISB2_ASCIM|nr:hypothetical protein BJ508DRAFT_372211 [Ascobolus immersus RN42]
MWKSFKKRARPILPIPTHERRKNTTPGTASTPKKSEYSQSVVNTELDPEQFTDFYRCLRKEESMKRNDARLELVKTTQYDPKTDPYFQLFTKPLRRNGLRLVKEYTHNPRGQVVETFEYNLKYHLEQMNPDYEVTLCGYTRGRNYNSFLQIVVFSPHSLPQERECIRDGNKLFCGPETPIVLKIPELMEFWGLRLKVDLGCFCPRFDAEASIVPEIAPPNEVAEASL